MILIDRAMNNGTECFALFTDGAMVLCVYFLRLTS